MIREYYLEIDPVSSNAAYFDMTWIAAGRAFSRRVMQTYYRNWKVAVKDLMILQDLAFGSKFEPIGFAYTISVIFVLRADEFYTQEGDYKKRDTSDMIKILEDAVAEYIQHDDKYVIDLYAHKRYASFSFILLRLSDEVDNDPSIYNLCPLQIPRIKI